MRLKVIFLCIVAVALAGVFWGFLKTPSRDTSPVVSHTFSPSVSPFSDKTTIVFVGDIMLSRTVGKRISESGDWSFPFRAVGDFLRDADITFGNLESVISDIGSDKGSTYSFRADSATAAGLAESGFDVLSEANNHSFDWGRAALADSVTRLTAVSIVPVGAGMTYEEANDARIIERNGLRFGFYAYTNLLSPSMNATESSTGLSEFNEKKIAARIKRDKEKKRIDFAIVSMHWGEEYATSSNFSQRAVAHALIDAGADIIVGHHPHTVQEVESYKGKLILYSLGNFVFDQYFSEGTMRGLVVRATISENGIDAEYFASRLNGRYQVQTIEATTPIFR